jgi:hypothetical protein
MLSNAIHRLRQLHVITPEAGGATIVTQGRGGSPSPKQVKREPESAPLLEEDDDVPISGAASLVPSPAPSLPMEIDVVDAVDAEDAAPSPPASAEASLASSPAPSDISEVSA